MPISPTTVRALDETQQRELAARLHKTLGKDLPFLATLIESMCRVLDGRFGAIFNTEGESQPRVLAVYPVGPDGKVRVEPQRMAVLKDCTQRCRATGEISVFRIGDGEQVVHAVSVPLIRQGAVEGVAVVLRPPAEEATLNSALAQVRWMAGLYVGHVARRMLGRQSQQVQQTHVALETLAATHHAEHFLACCMGACNRLKAELGALRVCIGWRQGDTVRLVAMSDTENIDRRAELNQRLEAAMEECFDQARPIVAPSHHLRGDDQWLALAVARCHQELIGDIGRAAACSVPLRHQDEVVGVLLVEQPGQSNFDGHSVAHLQAVADLIAPRLFDRKLDDQPVLKKLAQSAAAVVGVVLGPQHIATKLIVLIVASLLLYSVLAKWDYRLDATFTFEAGAKRVHSASFEGYLQSVLVEPGDAVKKGQELARLDDTELRLRLAEVESAIEQATTARLESMRENKLADAKRAAAQVQQLTAQRELYKFQLERAVLTSADDGVVLSGDWVEKQGVRVQLGEPIFEVAPISQLRAVIMVDESDIDRVAPGAAGELASRTYPDKLFGFRVTRIVPLGEAFEGRNVFQVYGELGEHADWMRPGMQGTAKIDAGRARVIWIGTHKLIDFLRLKLWW